MSKQKIIFLHGFGTLGGMKNRKAAFLNEKLAKVDSADFYAIDFNPTPKDFQYHTISGMIDRLRQFILLNDCETVCLIGISQGANVALNYAARYGGVEKLLLLAPELFYDPYISDEELAEWEELVSAPVFHYGFQKEIPLHIAHHRDGMRYLDAPEPPCPITLIHGRKDSAIPIERSEAYAGRFDDKVTLVEVDDDHSLRDHLSLISENAVLLIS